MRNWFMWFIGLMIFIVFHFQLGFEIMEESKLQQ